MSNEKTDEETENLFEEENSEETEIEDSGLKKLDDNAKVLDEKKEKIEYVKESEILTSTYNRKEISQEQRSSASEIMSNLNKYIEKDTKIETGKEQYSMVPTGIDLLDGILGGGFMTKLSMLVGTPGCGKSALVAKVLGTGQRKFGDKFLGIYIDTEQSQYRERLSELGVNCPEIDPYQKDITLEKVFEIIQSICLFKKENKILDVPSVVVWDSIANTKTQAGAETDDPNKVTGLQARILTHLLPKYVDKLNSYNIALVTINQLRDSLDMSAGPFRKAPDLKWLSNKRIPGGQSLLHNSSQILFMKSGSDLKNQSGDVYGFKGHKVTMHTIKNKVFTPNIPIETVLSYNFGFSNFWSNYELLKSFKVMQSKGTRFYLTGFPDKTFFQKDAIKVYKENEEFQKEFDSHVERIIKEEIISKKWQMDDEDKMIF